MSAAWLGKEIKNALPYLELVRHQQFVTIFSLYEQRGKAQKTVIIAQNGKGPTTRTIQRIVKSANQYHSSPIQITPRARRHTCASLMMANGAGIRDVQEL